MGTASCSPLPPPPPPPLHYDLLKLIPADLLNKQLYIMFDARKYTARPIGRGGVRGGLMPWPRKKGTVYATRKAKGTVKGFKKQILNISIHKLPVRFDVQLGNKKRHGRTGTSPRLTFVS